MFVYTSILHNCILKSSLLNILPICVHPITLSTENTLSSKDTTDINNQIFYDKKFLTFIKFNK